MKKLQRSVSNHDRAAHLRLKHTDLKHKVQKEIRRAYWTYVESIITPLETEKNKSNKRLFTYLKHAKKDSAGVGTLKQNGHTLIEPKDKANALNHQFESVFTQEEPIGDDLRGVPQQYPEAEDITVIPNGVTKLLKALDPNKAAGPDQISPRALKETADVLGPILTTIYNKSFETGELPQDWREADVVPVYKKGTK